MAENENGRRRAALVTGASYGIGAAVALGLTRDGFDVPVTDLRPSDLDRTVAGLRNIGVRAAAIALDVRSQDSVEAAFADSVSALGSLDLPLASPLASCITGQVPLLDVGLTAY